MPKLIRRDTGEEHELADGVTRIGRLSASNIQVFEKQVSRSHCDIEGPAGGWLLTDHGSKLGTFVNGRRVRQHYLHAGDLVKVGSAVFTFDDGTPPHTKPDMHPLSEAPAEQLVPPDPDELAEPEGARRRWSVVGVLPLAVGGVVVLAVVGGLLALAFATRQTPRRVVRRAAELVSRRDAEGLWRLVSAERQQQITLDEFRDQLRLVPEAVVAAMPGLEIGAERRVDVGVVVPVALEVEGRRVADEIVLFREDGDWKIHAVPMGRLRELAPGTGTGGGPP